MYGFCDMWVCVSVGSLTCGYVYVWGLKYMGVCMYGSCDVWVCVCMGFVMCGCLYEWVL